MESLLRIRGLIFLKTDINDMSMVHWLIVTVTYLSDIIKDLRDWCLPLHITNEYHLNLKNIRSFINYILSYKDNCEVAMMKVSPDY